MRGPGARVRAACIAGLALVAVSCASERAAPPLPAEQAALGGEVAARVGADVIPVALVAKVASAQHITPREALGRLVDDAICANAARARGLDRERPASWLLTAARARATADQLLAEALKAGPVTDAEIEDLTKAYWREVDRPPSVRVVHAVARKSPAEKPDVAADARARAFAPELRAALVDARDPTDFLAKARAFPHAGVQVIAEKLPAFADDGYSTETTGQMDVAFAKGAFALQTPGETSPVVESSFGWHVIRLVELIPEQRMGLEARRVAFADEAYTIRARAATEARLHALKTEHRVEVSPAADNLTRSLGAGPDHGPLP